MSLIHDKIDVLSINFGSPRVGNKKFSDFSAAKFPDHQRYTHHKDYVPHLPTNSLALLLGGYYHSGTEFYERKDGSFPLEGQPTTPDEIAAEAGADEEVRQRQAAEASAFKHR